MSNATDHAESLARDIRTNCDHGTPYGISEGYGDTPTGEPLTAWDYMEGVLDIEYRVGSDSEYRSAEILVSFGGPNVWVNTRTGSLIVTWWSNPVIVELPEEFIDGIDQVCRELWELR